MLREPSRAAWMVLALAVLLSAPGAHAEIVGYTAFQAEDISGVEGVTPSAQTGSLAVPDRADTAQITLRWESPDLWRSSDATETQLRLELFDSGPRPGDPTEQLAHAQGPSPLNITVDVTGLDELGWRVEVGSGVATLETAQGHVVYTATAPSSAAAKPAHDPAPPEPSSGTPHPIAASDAGTVGAVVGGVAVFAALAHAVRPRLTPILIGLYTRLGRDELLDNPVREALLERIREDPGVHLAALIDHTGAGNGAVRHHLEKLVEAGMVQRMEMGGYVRFFPPERLSQDAMWREAVLRRGSNRAVYELLADQPGLGIREVARRLDVSPSTAHRAVRQLRRAGLLPDPNSKEA